MINVVHSHPKWLPRTQTWMHSLIESLPPDQITSHIYCNKTEHLDQFQLPRIYELEKNQPISLFWSRVANKLKMKPLRINLLKKFVTKNKIDIVHSHFGNVGAMDCQFIQNSMVKHVVTFYGQDVSRLPLARPSILKEYATMFASVDRVLCEGPFMARRVVEELGCAPEKVVVQRLGVDLDRFPFKPRQWTPDQTLKVLVAGAFKEKKGIPYAIRAIGELAKTTKLSVTVIGDAVQQQASQDEKTAILKAIKETGLTDHVEMLGFQPYSKLMELAYKHHLFISTSVHAKDGDSEGGAPVTLIEMAATGIPIVSSHHCDIPGVVVDEETGWLAQERDVDAIVAKLQSAIESHAQWPLVLEKGRRRMETLFDLTTQGKQLAEIYQGIV